jgi:hypothetical protein
LGEDSIRQQQYQFTVRQEIANIEQRLMQLQQMQYNATVQQQQQMNLMNQNQQQMIQQNNFMQVQQDNPQTSEVALQALEAQQQAILHAQQMQANAEAAHARTEQVAAQAQAQTQYVAAAAQQEVQRTHQAAEHQVQVTQQIAQQEVLRTQQEAQQQVAQVTIAAQQHVNEQAAALQARAAQLVSESQSAFGVEFERQKQQIAAQAREFERQREIAAAQARIAMDELRTEAAAYHEAQRRAHEAEEELRTIRSNFESAPFTPPSRAQLFTSPQHASPLPHVMSPPGIPVYSSLGLPPVPPPPIPFSDPMYFTTMEMLLRSVQQIQHKIQQWE